VKQTKYQETTAIHPTEREKKEKLPGHKEEVEWEREIGRKSIWPNCTLPTLLVIERERTDWARGNFPEEQRRSNGSS